MLDILARRVGDAAVSLRVLLGAGVVRPYSPVVLARAALATRLDQAGKSVQRQVPVTDHRLDHQAELVERLLGVSLVDG